MQPESSSAHLACEKASSETLLCQKMRFFVLIFFFTLNFTLEAHNCCRFYVTRLHTASSFVIFYLHIITALKHRSWQEAAKKQIWWIMKLNNRFVLHVLHFSLPTSITRFRHFSMHISYISLSQSLSIYFFLQSPFRKIFNKFWTTYNLRDAQLTTAKIKLNSRDVFIEETT
jgi:hypothetical protein